MSQMEPVFGTVLKIKQKDRENGKMEREQLGLESHWNIILHKWETVLVEMKQNLNMSISYIKVENGEM